MAGGAAGLSAIRRVTLGLTASGRPIAQKPARQGTPAAAEPKEKKSTPASRTKAGTKRKRGAPKAQDDDSSSVSSLSDTSDNEDGAQQPATPSAPPILTKSGRHVQKPVAYNPAEMESLGGAKKRVHYSKVRTAEQALCKSCTRMHSPATNQMVFCDGCNEGWHQMCHDPWIEDAVVRDTKTAWFCASCQAKRDRHYSTTTPHPPKKQKVAGPVVRESWAGRTPQVKRAYLSTLSSQELVGLLMHSLELHPDLPIFPGSAGEPATAPSTPGTPQTPSDVHNNPSAKKGAGQKGAKGVIAPPPVPQRQQQQDNGEESEADPLEPPWPKPGRGLYSMLPPEEADDFLADENDFEAFSVIVYDEKGRKIEENGIKVVRA